VFGQQAKFDLNLLHIANYALGILGACMLDLTGTNLIAGIVWGGLLFGYWTFLFVVKKQQSFFAYLFLFIVGTCLIIAIPRSGDDWTNYNSSRYFLYAPLAIISLYGMSLNQFPRFRKIIFIGTSIFACVFCFASYQIHTTQMLARLQVNQADNDNWIRNQRVVGNVPQVFINDQKIVQDAFQLHFMDQEPAMLSQQDLAGLSADTPVWSLDEKMLVEHHANPIRERNAVWVKRFDYLLFPNFKGENTFANSWFVLMQHEQTKTVFTVAVNFKKGSMKQLLTAGRYLSNYGIAQVYTDGMPSGNYKLFLMHRNNSQSKMYRLTQSHEIRN
jgi:hypothetical protein